MKTVVLFFSRTGNSKRIAEKIANALGTRKVEITDNKNWNGFLGFIKASFYSLKEKSVDIKINEDVSEFEQYIVVCPLWAGKIAPAAKEFIKQIGAEKIYLVISSDSSDIEKEVSNIENIYGKLKGNLSIVSKEKNEENQIDKVVRMFE